jgi:hypothetical protein
MKNVVDTIASLKTFFRIECAVETKKFPEHKAIPTKRRGVYVLVDEQGLIVYVGKGNVKARQVQHWNKAHNIIKPGTIDPKGWKWLRENYQVQPSEWTVYFVDLKRETELSAMEGGLIHLLQPLANDETFKDEERTLNNA